MTTKIEDIALAQEDGKLKTSVDNAEKCGIQHGDLIAAFHTISGRGRHSTKLFYEDGFVHTCLGFRCGEGENERSEALQELLSQIPSIETHLTKDYLTTQIGQTTELKKAANQYISLHYAFRPPANANESVFCCKGFRMFEESINLLSNDEHSEIIEGEW